MWSKKSKTIITTESREILTFRRISKKRLVGYCAECGGEVSFLTLDEAVEHSRHSAKKILRGMDAGEVHTNETANGQLLFCGKSLAERKV